MDILDISKFEIHSDLDPLKLFEDITYVGNDIEGEDKARQIQKICLKQEYIAFIDNDSELGWIFHTILRPDGKKSVKNIASVFSQKETTEQIIEKQIEKTLIKRLKKQGIPAAPQFRCSAGIADIVTPSAIYEIKLRLTRDSLFHAIGQVLLYRESIDPSRQAIVVGVNSGIEDLIPLAKKIGVEVELWPMLNNFQMDESQLGTESIKCKVTSNLLWHTDMTISVKDRTRADKRRAVLAVLSDEEWLQWSDREIAKLCNTNHSFVSRLRKSTSAVQHTEKLYLTKHGTVSRMNTKRIGLPKTEKD
jgi:hypothetical protein